MSQDANAIETTSASTEARLLALETGPTWIPLALTVFISAWLTGPLAVLSGYMPRPVARALPWFLAAMALEAILVTRWLAQPERRLMNKPQYRAAELLLWLIALRLLLWVTAGFPSGSGWLMILRQPWLVLDPLFVLSLFLGVAAWERGISWSRLFGRLQLAPEEVAFYGAPVTERLANDAPIRRDRLALVSQFAQVWFMYGLVLVVFAAMATVDLPALADGAFRSVRRLALPPQLIVGLIVYFVLGFYLLSWARFQAYHVRWVVAGTQVGDDTRRHWHRTGWIVMLIVAGVAAFLPIGSTFAASIIVNTMITVIVAIVSLMLYLVLLLLGWLGSLFGMNTPDAELNDAAASEIVPPPFEAAPMQEMGERAQLIVGTTVWIILIVVGVLALLLLLRQRGRLNLSGIRLLLLDLWQNFLALWRGVKTTAAGVVQRVTGVELTAAEGERSRFGFIRVNQLPPRDQIRYFYLSTLRRAQQRGVPRRQGETPLEFADDLKAAWPDADVDVDALTDAFVHAQYSPQDVAEDDVGPVKSVWRRVRQALRNRRRKATNK